MSGGCFNGRLWYMYMHVCTTRSVEALNQDTLK